MVSVITEGGDCVFSAMNLYWSVPLDGVKLILE